MIFMRTVKIKGLSPYMKKINVDILIRDAVYAQDDIILIPDSTIYNSDLFYENHTLDRLRKKKATDLSDRNLWVYHGLDPNTRKMFKRSIYHLENKHYVAALLSIPYSSSWKAPKEVKEKEQFINFQNFLQGRGKQPILKNIYKNTKNIDGKERYDLEENIENSITLHWIYIHRDKLNDFIEEYVN
jgi:hypothetical protein